MKRKIEESKIGPLLSDLLYLGDNESLEAYVEFAEKGYSGEGWDFLYPHLGREDATKEEVLGARVLFVTVNAPGIGCTFEELAALEGVVRIDAVTRVNNMLPNLDSRFKR